MDFHRSPKPDKRVLMARKLTKVFLVPEPLAQQAIDAGAAAYEAAIDAGFTVLEQSESEVVKSGALMFMLYMFGVASEDSKTRLGPLLITAMAGLEGRDYLQRISQRRDDLIAELSDPSERRG